MSYVPPYDESDPIEEEAEALLKELGLSYRQACVGFDEKRWHVTIYERRKKPALRKWAGLPIIYRINNGQLRPFSAKEARHD